MDCSGTPEMFGRRIIGRFSRSLTDIVFPPYCPLCGQWVELPGAAFCARCAATLNDERSEEACPTCGATVARFEVSQGQCSECRGRPVRVLGTVRVGPYGTCLGRLLRLYKYRGRTELGRTMGTWLAEVVARAPWRDRVEAVLSVPTHWSRRIRRRFHPAEQFAAAVGRKTGLPYAPLLQRIRGGKHQIGLSHTERARNVLGAFAIPRGVSFQGARLLLIDDVRTTGATIAECAKVLRQGGAEEIYAAVVVQAGGTRVQPQLLAKI